MPSRPRASRRRISSIKASRCSMDSIMKKPLERSAAPVNLIPPRRCLYAESLMDLNPWKLWTLDGKPNEGTDEIVRMLESVLRRDPNHAGANHYYIHAVEASPHPERALPSARRLDTMVPQAGHLVHMPAHIYIHTGEYGAAVKNNAEAVKIDRVYAQKAKIGRASWREREV